MENRHRLLLLRLWDSPTEVFVASAVKPAGPSSIATRQADSFPAFLQELWLCRNYLFEQRPAATDVVVVEPGPGVVAE